MKIGIFGGTFDPPHIAHFMIANQAISNLGLDRVLWVLTSRPPHKEGEQITSLDYRLEMVAAAISGEPLFELSRVDIDRPPPHYAVDTVLLLRRQYPDDDLIYLMGGDSLRDLPTWHTPQAFVKACDGIAVVRRPEAVFDIESLEDRMPWLIAKLQFVDAPVSQISASDIRQRARSGRPFREYIQPAVHDIIRQHKLYQSTSS